MNPVVHSRPISNVSQSESGSSQLLLQARPQTFNSNLQLPRRLTVFVASPTFSVFGATLTG